jgi:hypothetical protein
MPALKKTLALKLALAFALIGSGCGANPGPPNRLPGETILGSTKAAHSLTRGHNRKVICDTNFNHWYVFWLRDDGKPSFNRNEEGVVYQVSSDGLAWSQPVVVEPFQEGGVTAWDVVSEGTRLYLLGLTDYPEVSGKTSKYAIRELEIKADGSLAINSPQVVYENRAGSNASIHFYGSLLHDSEGYFWIAARVGDSSPRTHADIIRSTAPGSIGAWGATGCIGQLCNNEWIDPYAKSGRSLLQGTVASRLLDLGKYGIGLVTYNKNDADAKRNARGQILFVRNPNRKHDGWEPASVLLTDIANQYIKAGSTPDADKTRLDDRRFAAIVDPYTHVIHVAYITADKDTPEGANLRYFTLSPPYRIENKSIETTLIGKEVDGLHLAIDTRNTPAVLYLFYVANNHPNYQLRMIRNIGNGWSPPSNISNGVGIVRYPQPPEIIVKNEIIVAYQYSEKTSEGMTYQICVRKIDLAPAPGIAK